MCRGSFLYRRSAEVNFPLDINQGLTTPPHSPPHAASGLFSALVMQIPAITAIAMCQCSLVWRMSYKYRKIDGYMFKLVFYMLICLNLRVSITKISNRKSENSIQSLKKKLCCVSFDQIRKVFRYHNCHRYDYVV